MDLDYDPRLTEGSSPPKRNDAAVALHHELSAGDAIDALTALGLWLATVNRKVQDRRDPKEEQISEILTKAMRQHRRASEAVCRLRDLLRRECVGRGQWGDRC